jgi:hypothetical protein
MDLEPVFEILYLARNLNQSKFIGFKIKILTLKSTNNLEYCLQKYKRVDNHHFLRRAIKTLHYE